MKLRAKLLASALLGVILGSFLLVNVEAQGPYTAQIQRALNAFVGSAHTWTALQTFSGGTAITGPSSADSFCLDSTNKDVYIGRVGANDLGFYTGATNCATGTLRFDVSATAVTSALLVKLPDGTVGAPSATFTSGAGLGLYVVVAGSQLGIAAGAGHTLANFIDSTAANLAADLALGWTSNAGNATTAGDTSVSRVSAGVVGVGTGATGSFGGTLKTTTVNAVTAFQVNGTAITSGTTHLSSGAGMSVANVGANSCGTTSATIAGNNNAFVITVGTVAGTQCRVAFTFAAATEWDCAANDDTTTVAVRVTPVDTTHTDLLGAFTAGDKLSGICFPR